MIIYVDVLIITNLIVDYFLLKACEKISRIKLKIFRIISASVIGAFSSLYIFLPINNFFIDLLFKLVLCFVMSAVAYKFKNFKRFIKFAFLLFVVTGLFAGLMMAVWQIFKPNGMYAEKFVVYFNISPIVLSILSIVFYLSLNLSLKIFSRTAPCSKRCEITVFLNEKNIKLNALVDTGNSLTDIFGESEIIIVDSKYVNNFLKDIKQMENRFRVIPFKSISGEDLLNGYRMDRAVILNDNRIIELKSPIIALSKTKMDDDFNAIINPQILE